LACHLQTDADPDPYPTLYFDADPDPAYHFDADPDPDHVFQFDADQDPQHRYVTVQCCALFRPCPSKIANSIELLKEIS
jgi:hypothetical protein